MIGAICSDCNLLCKPVIKLIQGYKEIIKDEFYECPKCKMKYATYEQMEQATKDFLDKMEKIGVD